MKSLSNADIPRETAGVGNRDSGPTRFFEHLDDALFRISPGGWRTAIPGIVIVGR